MVPALSICTIIQTSPSLVDLTILGICFTVHVFKDDGQGGVVAVHVPALDWERQQAHEVVGGPHHGRQVRVAVDAAPGHRQR